MSDAYLEPPNAKALGLPKMSWPPNAPQFSLPPPSSIESIQLIGTKQLQIINSKSVETVYEFKVSGSGGTRTYARWSCYVRADSVKRIYKNFETILPVLPPWPKSKSWFGSGKQKPQEIVSRLSQLTSWIGSNQHIGSLPSVHATFAEQSQLWATGEQLAPVTGVLYLAIVNTENVGVNGLRTDLSLELLSPGAVVSHHITTKLHNYASTAFLYTEFNVVVNSQAHEYLRISVMQPSTSSHILLDVVHAFELALPTMQAYQNYHLKLPMITATGVSQSFLNVRATFVPMMISDKIPKVLRLTSLSRLRIQTHKVHYSAGEVIRGTIHYTTPTLVKIDALSCRLFGMQEAKWTETRGPPRNQRTVSFAERRVLVDDARILYLKPKPVDQSLQPGFYFWPFEIKIPAEAPSTCKYAIQASLEGDHDIVVCSSKGGNRYLHAELGLWVNGPKTASHPELRRASLALPNVGEALVTFPSHFESFRNATISLLLRPDFAAPKDATLKLSFHVRTKMHAEGQSRVITYLKKFGHEVSLRSLPPPEETKEGLLHRITIFVPVRGTCSGPNSPLIETTADVKFKLIVGDVLAKSRTPTAVFAPAVSDAPWSFYPAIFADCPLPGRNTKERIEVKEQIRRLDVKLYSQVSAQPSLAEMTQDIPPAGESTTVVFPIWEGYVSSQAPVLGPESSPEVSVTYLGSQSPNYPAPAAVPHLPSSETDLSLAAYGSSSSSSAHQTSNETNSQ